MAGTTSQRPSRSSSRSPLGTARVSRHDEESTSASVESPDPSILVRLSGACSRHGTTHSSQEIFELDRPSAQLPAKCQRDLRTLCNLIPKVEATYPPDAGGTHASDVSHLCKFYWTVLTGAFCPHSLNIFDWGRDIVNLVSRIHHLLRHLSSKTIIQNAFEKQNNASTEKGPQKAVATEISETVAHLLNLVTEPQMQKCIIHDLLALAFDLATIAEAGILGDGSDGGGEQEDIEIVIFEATLNNGNSNNHEELTLQLSTTGELLTLQAGTFAILESLSTSQRKRRLEYLDNGDASISTNLPSTHVDCCFVHCLDGNGLVSTLLATTKQALLFIPSRDGTRNDTSKNDELLWRISMQNKVAASTLLCMLLEDWERVGESPACALTELSLLIPRAVLEYFAARKATRKRLSDAGDARVYASLLSRLICQALLFPTRMGGHLLLSETLWNIRSQTLLPLLDCVPAIVEGDSHTDNSLQSLEIAPSSSCWSGEEMTLRTIVLRAIHASLYTEMHSSEPSFDYIPLRRQASSHCIANEIFPSLFAVLKEIPLSNVVIAVISKLVQPENVDSASGVLDFLNVCRVVWRNHTTQQDEDKEGTESRELRSSEEDRSDPNSSTPLSSAKRKRLNFSPKSKGSALPKLLQPERSPKRRRRERRSGSFGQSLVQAGSVATPSPFSVLDPPLEEHNPVDTATPCSLHDGFAGVLHDALEIASKILPNPGDINAATSGNNRQRVLATDSKLLDDVLVVAAASRLTLDILRRKLQDSEFDQCCEEYKDAFDILSYLLRSLNKVCINVASTNSTEAVVISVARAIEVIAGLGLHAQLTCDAIVKSACPEIPNFASIYHSTMDTFSRIATTAWTNFVESDDDQSVLEVSNASEGRKELHNGVAETCCCGLCVELFESFGSMPEMSTEPELSRCSPCLCKFLAEYQKGSDMKPLSSPENGQMVNAQIDFQNDCAAFLLEQLPRQSKWALLACLRPVDRGTFVGEEVTAPGASDSAGRGATPSTLETLCFFLDPSHVSPEACSDICVASSITLLPVLLLALGSRVGDSSPIRGLSQDTDGGQNSLTESDAVSRCSAVLSNFQFLNYLLPHAISPFTSRDGMCRPSVARAACVSLLRIEEMLDHLLSAEVLEQASLPFVSGILSTARGLLGFLSSKPSFDLSSAGRIDSQRPDKIGKTTSVQEVYRSIRIALLSAQHANTVSVMPPSLRLAMWKFVAWTCVHSSRSDLRQNITKPEKLIDLAVRFAERAVYGDTPEGGGHVDDRVAIEKLPSPVFLPSPLWLVYSAFADGDESFRNYASRELGQVLLGSDSCLLQAMFSTNEEWGFVQQEMLVSADNLRLSQAIAPTVERMFQLVDHLLYQFCSVPQSQLSLTMEYRVAREAALESSNTNPSADTDPSKAVSFQRSALCALSSLCRKADLNTACGVLVFEHAFLRLVRFWIAIEKQVPEAETLERKKSISALAFWQISELNLHRPLGEIVTNKCKANLTPLLFSDILVLSSSPVDGLDGENQVDCLAPESRERQFRLLFLFIQFFLINCQWKRHDSSTPEREDVSGGSTAAFQIYKFVDEVLPSVLPAFVLWEDYDSLRLICGFRLFLLGEQRRLEDIERRFEYSGTAATEEHGNNLVGDLLTETSLKARSRVHGIKESTKELDEQTKLLCLHPRQLQQILPKLLLAPDRKPLDFFLQTVVRQKVPLQQMVKLCNLKLLRTLVFSLGSADSMDDESTFQPKDYAVSYGVRAIRKGALAMELEQDTENGAKRPCSSLAGVDAVERDAGRGAGGDAASRWISSNFMYLLVNVVQFKWKFRPPAEKIRSLRCLRAILHFLSPHGSPQYIPQVMTTVNMAMSDDLATSDGSTNQKDVLRLRLIAVQALSQFVRIVVGYQPQSIGSELTTIVVSLFPVLCPHQAFENHTEEFRCMQRATVVAVELLEWLVAGDLGKQLAPYFGEIPFLPPSRTLEKVRTELKANGVNFDNLLVLSATQPASAQLLTSRSSNSQDGTLSRPHFSSHAQAGLHRRLDMLCPLLSHENVNVRRVVLGYLTDLLSSNRLLFYRTLENHDGSAGHLMTVVYSKSARYGSCASIIGSVAAMLKALLTRCVLEDDPETRTLLATAIGEIGAIDSNRLADITSLNVESESDDGSWRLLQPPWKSRVTRYELQLVTNHLVKALKAAPTPAEQHKIAFTIQQLLVLLNASAEHSTPGDKLDAIDVDSPVALTGASKGNRGEMNVWLAEKLRKATVHDVIEPFWSTAFQESDQPFRREPPFFRISETYFQWISRWCGFMVKRSTGNDRSRWRDLFYACRTAIRAAAGVEVAEFIIPLLVLDSICFGDELDERVALQEIRDALTFTEMDEFSSVTSSDRDVSSMQNIGQGERQKAVSCAFAIMDTLEYWAECETEERHKGSPRGISSRLASAGKGMDSISSEQASTNHWPADQSISKIEDFLQAVPLSLRAKAAAAVGMHARALRIIEMEARAHVVDQVFNTGGQRRGGNREKKLEQRKPLGGQLVDGVDKALLKQVLGKLDDCSTMKAVGQETLGIDVSLKLRESIREREAYGDWSGAVQEYERALQLDGEVGSSPSLHKGMLRCLLELGQFESVLNQVNGIISQQQSVHAQNGAESRKEVKNAFATPFAVEAAWRLGRWSALENLVDNEKTVEHGEIDTEGLYQVSVGRAMLGLKKRSSVTCAAALRDARDAVMTSLSSLARESYSRCYGQFLRLQCLREIENASDKLCSTVSGSEHDSLDVANSLFSTTTHSTLDEQEWDARLEVVSSLGTATIINSRLALARLAGDSRTEGSLFLTVGKTARKSGLYHVSENSLAQAESAFARISPSSDQGMQRLHLEDLLSSVQIQLAKLKHCEGESGSALRILGVDDVQQLSNFDDSTLRERVLTLEREKSLCPGVHSAEDGTHVDRFARKLLQSTQWMVEGGLKGGSEVMSRFRLVQRLCPKWEKSYFHFAKYVDSLLECRISALASQPSQLGADDDVLRESIFFRDASCQKYLLLAMKHYGESLKISAKHVYQALPRLLTLWFDFTSINGDELFSQSKTPSSSASGRSSRSVVDPHERFRTSQHEANELMVALYKTIPAQSFYTAMPQIISRVGHRDKDTVNIVLVILVRVLIRFPSRALWSLAWLRNSVSKERSSIGEKIFKEAQKSFQNNKDKKSHDLLVASKSLFRFLIDLAKYQPKDPTRNCSIRPWSGDVELMEFVPPVQAALSVSRPSLSKSSSRDVFPALVPRMRSFCSKVQIMTSKARPKKLKAFAVPAQQLRSPRAPPSATAAKTPQPGDIGEMHFLVKQEAKGDLRKDARVQDLNNVINRLLTTSGGSAQRRQRKLHLRTFSVVCLSEECGILEWVPHTDSLRNLVSASYNPQAEPFSIRRRGQRIGNYGDITTRKSFEECQAMYKTNGHLARAAKMFEEKLLKPNPPVLYWWFVQNFHDPHAWYEARTRFTVSAAAWSAVGHVIGLGDRHSENILVDKSTGDVVHVDFDCIFDKGLNLPQPEVVPFRLTANMLDAFGPTGADGTFSAFLKSAMSTLRGNRDTLLSVLEPFLKDPVIDWKRRQKQGDKSGSRETMAAKRSIKVIDGRLKGIYNVRVPAARRVRRTDGVDQDDEMTHLIPLSVEGQVHKMITEATSCENLVQIYVGWMPWL